MQRLHVGGFVVLGVLMAFLCSCGAGNSSPRDGTARTTSIDTRAAISLVGPTPVCAPRISGPFARDIDGMQLLTNTAGWVWLNHRLRWTGDGGSSWRDITPPDLEPSSAKFDAGELAYFLDASMGWVLATRPHDAQTPSDLLIWRTTDGGATWERTRLDGPKVDPEIAPPVFSPLALQFVDAQHGWLALRFASGNMGGTEVFATTDGGTSWHSMPWLGGFNGSQGPLHFGTAEDGWEAWNNGQHDVFVTHDGASSWETASFVQPTGMGDARAWMSGFWYGAVGPNEGVIPANHYGGNDPEDPKVGLYATQDAGRTWTFVGRTPNDKGVLFFLSGETWMQATATHIYETERRSSLGRNLRGLGQSRRQGREMRL